MKNIFRFILLFTTFLTLQLQASFNFGSCSGSGTFEQEIIYYDKNYEQTALVGTIPQGIQGLHISLVSDKDVDIRLYGENDDRIVHWPYGILYRDFEQTKPYKDVNITYSGFNGVGGKKGHEFIEVDGTTPTAMTMKAFGYQAGYATVNYSWTGKVGCTQNQSGSGSFTQTLEQNATSLVGTIPPNVDNVKINLTSSTDLDIQLYGADGTAIASWKPTGLLAGATKQSIMHHDMNITWSGYNGVGGQLGHEYITITPKTTEVLVMKVYGYKAGEANVTYSWGEGEVENKAPVAVIAPIDLNLTRAAFENIGVTLDATQSTDSDGRIIKYEWYVDGSLLSQVNTLTSYGLASNISLSEAEGTEHSLSLKVTDNKGATHTKKLYFSLKKESAGFLVKPNLTWDYGLNHVSIDANTMPESNVTITVTASKPNMFNGQSSKRIVFSPEDYKNITLYYSMPKTASENYTIHFDVSHSDDINYEGIQLEDINLTYDPEILKVNPPKGSKEFVSGEKGTLEFIYSINDMTASIIDDRNIFYKGATYNLNYALIDAPQGMVLNGLILSWTPTQAQSNQSYTVMVKVSDGLVEKTVTFDVFVAKDTYLHTEVQNGKLVVVDPTSKLDGLTVEPKDGSDPGLMKIKIAPDGQVPKPLHRENERVKLTDVFMIENKPTKYVISIKNEDSFMQKLGVSKMAFIYYLKHGETNHTSYSRSWEARAIKNGVIEVFNRNGRIGGADRPYFYFETKAKYLLSSLESSTPDTNGMTLDFKMPSVQKVNSTLCQALFAYDSYGDQEHYYIFHCNLNAKTTVIIEDIEKPITSPDYTMSDGSTPDTLVQWLKDAQNNVSQLGIGASNISEGNLTITIEMHPEGGGLSMRKDDKENNYGITVDRNQSKFDNVRKNLLVHEYFHIVQNKALGVEKSDGNWKTEGTAKWFEDYGSFDGGDSYKKYAGLNPLERVLSNQLTAFDTRYKTFAFWKMLMNQCNDSIVTKMFDSHDAYEGGIETLKTSLNTSGCDFGVRFDAISANESSLESAMYAYQFATVQENDISLLDANENKSNFDFQPVLEVHKGQWIDGTMDINRGLFLGKVPPYGAVSFRISKEILNAENGLMFWKLKAKKDLLVIYTLLDENSIGTTADTSVNPRGKYGLEDRFYAPLKANTEFKFNMIESDMQGGVLVTLVNTSDEEVYIDELIMHGQFLRDDDKRIVTDYLSDTQWTDGDTKGFGSYLLAENDCYTTTYGGYDDWILSTISDLENIVDLSRNTAPYVYDTFKNISDVGYWSLGWDFDTQSAMVMNFQNGATIPINISYSMSHVCVRSISNEASSSQKSNNNPFYNKVIRD